ncbi:hypothetical protein DRJ17_04130 [Candidatus Woesearchaeota archaeon]|nr:MAG: hypothetical protein DRJ17_04130 [Candidatus Woesearchaeota archaeon]
MNRERILTEYRFYEYVKLQDKILLLGKIIEFLQKKKIPYKVIFKHYFEINKQFFNVKIPFRINGAKFLIEFNADFVTLIYEYCKSRVCEVIKRELDEIVKSIEEIISMYGEKAIQYVEEIKIEKKEVKLMKRPEVGI